MDTKQLEEICVTQCKPVITKRNRYFTGKYMTKLDFEHEQSYFLSRHHLHNRLLHGWGIVCGLEVIEHPDPECKKRWVIIKAGIAMDCCGRELVLETDQPFELPLPDPNRPDDPDTMPGPFLIAIRYAERKIERVPALYDEGSCTPDQYDFNRVQEMAKPKAILLEKEQTQQWLAPAGDPPHCHTTIAVTPPVKAPGFCLEADEQCAGVVPLACIDFDPNCLEAGFKIILDGRQQLPLPGARLTHIVGTNWPHGGSLTLADLRDRNGRLEVYFDRPIQAAPTTGNDGLGINEYTMKVQLQGARDSFDLPFDPKQRPKLENGSLAVFTIDPNFISGSGRQHDIEDRVVTITLFCDFIVDTQGQPVDGNHLKARLPSGDGTPGGIFRSWFHIVDRDSPPVIALAMSGVDTAEPGSQVTLLYSVTNRNTTDLYELTIIQDPGLDGEKVIDKVDEPLLAGGPAYSSKLNLSIQPEATSPYVVILQAQAVDKDGTHTYDTCQHTIRLTNAKPTLEISKSLKAEEPAQPNRLTAELVIRNNSAHPLKDVVLVERTQASTGTVSLESNSHQEHATVAVNGRLITWRWRELPPHCEETIRLVFLVENSGDLSVVENEATITAEGPNRQRLTACDTAKQIIKRRMRDQQ